MSDKSDQIAGSLSNKGASLHVLEDFLAHPGWKMYSQMVREQSQARTGEVLLKKLQTAGDIYGQEFTKGEISGLSLAEVLPFTTLEVLKSEVQTLQVQLEQENEIEKRIADGGSRSRVDDERFHSE